MYIVSVCQRHQASLGAVRALVDADVVEVGRARQRHAPEPVADEPRIVIVTEQPLPQRRTDAIGSDDEIVRAGAARAELDVHFAR